MFDPEEYFICENQPQTEEELEQFPKDYTKSLRESLYIDELDERIDYRKIIIKQGWNKDDTAREAVVCWLSRTCHHFALHDETLYTAIRVMDCYLSRTCVAVGDLMLLGAASLAIAIKFGETFLFSFKELKFPKGTREYTLQEYIKLERAILFTIDFSIKAVFPLHYLPRFMHAVPTEKMSMIKNLSLFILELSQAKLKMRLFRPSHLAVCAVYLAARIILYPENPGLEEFVRWSNYSREEIAKGSEIIRGEVLNKCRYKNDITEKFSSDKYQRIALEHF